MSTWVKLLATKSVSSIPKTHIVEGELTSANYLQTSTQELWNECIPPPHTHT